MFDLSRCPVSSSTNQASAGNGTLVALALSPNPPVSPEVEVGNLEGSNSSAIEFSRALESDNQRHP
jgi:hypothetical protein